MKNNSKLIVHGDCYLTDSTGLMTQVKLFNTARAVFEGDLHMWGTVAGYVELEVSNSATVELHGNIYRSGPDFFGSLNCSSTSTFKFVGTTPQIMDMQQKNGVFWRYGEVHIDNPAGVTLNESIVQGDVNHTVSDSICVLPGAIFYSGGFSIELSNNMLFDIQDNATYYTTTQDAYGGMMNPAGTAYHDIHDNSTVIFAAIGDQNIPNPDVSEDYGNVIVMGTGTKTLTDNIDIRGNLTIDATGNLDLDSAGDYSINLGGDWTDNGTFNAQEGNIIFDGSSDQYIYGVDEQFYDFTMNKPTGDVYLDVSPVITHEFDLTSGDVVLDVNDLTLDYTASVTGAPGSSSYVQANGSGEMRKRFNSAPDIFEYPVGDVSDYSPIELSLNSATFGGLDHLGVNVRDFRHPQNFTTHYIERYWKVNYQDFTALDYDFRFVYNVADVVGTESLLDAIRRTASAWETHDPVNTGTHEGTSATPINDLPVDQIITAGAGSVLPIELANFDATVVGDKVHVNFATATEINNDFFTLERSKDGIEFEMLGTIDGKGTSYTANQYSFVDDNPHAGVSYYRLKQTDFDGTTVTFDPVSVSLEASSVFNFRTYPNPLVSGEDLNIDIKGVDAGEEMLVVLYDAYGKEVFSKVVVSGNGSVLNGTELSEKLSQGVYYIVGTSNDKIFKEKLVIAGNDATIR
jgi:hypothetical protein